MPTIDSLAARSNHIAVVFSKSSCLFALLNLLIRSGKSAIIWRAKVATASRRDLIHGRSSWRLKDWLCRWVARAHLALDSLQLLCVDGYLLWLTLLKLCLLLNNLATLRNRFFLLFFNHLGLCSDQL